MDGKRTRIYKGIDELFRTIRTYYLVLESSAGIACLNKNLRINEKLRKEARKSDLGMFDHIENETFEMNN